MGGNAYHGDREVKKNLKARCLIGNGRKKSTRTYKKERFA